MSSAFWRADGSPGGRRRTIRTISQVTAVALVASGSVAMAPAAVAAVPAAEAADLTPVRFDFGPGAVQAGYEQVTADTAYSPERGYGFVEGGSVTDADRGGDDALRGDFVTPAGATFVVDLDNVDYTVSLIAGDAEGATDIAITSEFMQKVQPTSRATGEYLEMSYDIALVDGQLSFTFSGETPNIAALEITPHPAREAAAVPTAYLTGDSTMQTYDPYWEPQAGWGQMFERFLSDDVAVDNQSIGGRSSRSFLEQGRLDTVLRSVRPGDYVFTQFGHNDATESVPERYTSPEDFREYLKIYVEGTRQRGGIPVLVTPVNRLDVNTETGLFNESFPEYVQAVKDVSAELDVDMVDLSASSRAYLDAIGVENAKSVFLHVPAGVYPNRPDGTTDNTHFQEYGAIQMARLVATDVAELGLPISDAVEVTTPDAVPAAPAGVSVTGTTGASVSLAWDETEGADIYRIYRAPSGSDDFALAGTSTIPQASISGLEEGAAYDFRVAAANGLGEGERSAVVSATTRVAEYRYDFGPVGSVVAEGFDEVTRDTIYDEETGFGLVDASGMIDRDRGSDLDDVARDFVAEFGGEYEFVTDVPNGEYSAAVTVGDLLGTVRTNVEMEGRDLGGVSASRGASEKVFEDIVVRDGQLSVTITGQTGHLNGLEITPILVAPTGLALDGVEISGQTGTVALSWQAAPEAESYRVYRTAPDGAAELVAETEGTSATDDTAAAGSSYSYAVAAVTPGGESVPSEEVAVDVIDPDVAAPAAPTGLAAVDVQAREISLSWDETDTALFYLVSRAESADGDFEVVGRTDEAAFTDTDVLTTVPFFYRVQAVNAGGAGAASDVLETPAETVLARDAERIGRQPVAVAQDGGVYLGWRMNGDDAVDVAFHVYRDGERITAEPVTGSTNLLDADGSADATYRVSEVTDDGEVWATDEFGVWGDQFLDVPLDKPEGGYTPDGQPYEYTANDATVGDVDGDGQYEVVLLWNPTNAKDNSQSGYTGNVFLDAYELDGQKLWRIDLGRNIRAGAHYSQPMLADVDGNGSAELFVKTADGTVDGEGTVIGDADADWRNSSGYVLQGPEFLTVFEGATGRAVDTIDFIPERGDVSSWGDGYGNRVDRFLASVAYLDGEHPSVVLSRGYYTRAVISAFDFDGEKISTRWTFDSSEPGNGDYYGQGNHNMNVADIDGDQKDEIVYGSAAIDDDGEGLYSTGLGHGDALHVSDFDPSRPGLEVFAAQEDMGRSGNRGATFRDAATGEILWDIPAERDTGRAAMADIDPRYEGAEGWAVGGDAAWNSRVGQMKSASGELVSETIPAANFVGLWDGDLLSEIVDHDYNAETGSGSPVISKWDYEAGEQVAIFSPEGVLTNNSTKGNPALQADVFGDWREEVMYRTTDSSALRIFTTVDVTEHKLRTLMSDPAYRVAVQTQLSAYNQPPHTSYFLGEGMATPAAPSLHYTTPAPEAEPVAASPVSVDVSARTVGKSVMLEVSATNTGEGAVRVEVSSAFGDRKIPRLGAGAERTVRIHTHERDVAAGTIEVTVTDAAGEVTTTTVAYDAQAAR
ncbi:fibronectin type III domain-containing protein [Microbacterium sp. ZXX196]|uniref:rhamnogalacturonan lyase family protein n=1 Tax=Microbacterium sp. ZXX196 TaxID=2609291 RepID=UPI0012B944E8|nr:fibronectin type III domain-containing protein [Microbacterium sp. ZXX196]MTE23576.1 G-D-S-L family lipolytic protein [Microbacterium sp. ZXX196]